MIKGGQNQKTQHGHIGEFLSLHAFHWKKKGLINIFLLSEHR